MKRFLSIMLAFVMTLSCFAVVSADDVVLEITKQPTLSDPSVEVNLEDGVEYQWYKADEYAEGDITNVNGEVLSIADMLGAETEIPDELAQMETIAESASYSEEDGWAPAIVKLETSDIESETPSSYYVSMFTVTTLKGGSVLTLTFNDLDSLMQGNSAFIGMNLEESNILVLNFDENGNIIGEIPEDGTYALVLISDFDPSAYRLKAFGTAMSYEPIEGETDAVLSEIERGGRYRCEITAADGTTVYSNSFEAVYEIISQPTASNPTFEVRFEDDASFQWYEVTKVYGVIDDTMTEYNYGTFDAETGEWTPDAGDPYDYSGYQEYSAELFEVYLEAGQVVTVTLDNPDAVSPADPDFRFYNVNDDDSYFHEEFDENGVLVFTVPVDGIYELYHFCIYPETTTVKVETVIYEYELLEGETEKTLQNPELGALYAVSATYEDETMLRSDVFEMEYAFIKQPTAKDPSVEVNYKEDVESYQWYNVGLDTVEVTDEYADPAHYPGSSIGDPSYYDEENGYWVPSLYDTYIDDEGETYYEYDIFEIDLEEGQVLTLIPSAEIIDEFIYTGCDEAASEEDFEALLASWVFEDGVYTFVAPYSSRFYIYVDTYAEDITLTATISDVLTIGDAVEGADKEELFATQAGDYLCVVTYENGIELVSDIVTLTEDDVMMLGDVNNDGAINQYDYILVKRHYFGTRILSDAEMRPADVNNDNKVDQYDYILICRHYFGTYTIKG